MSEPNEPWFVTGAAGFIGAAVCERLLDQGVHVVGVDNFNDYYDPSLKEARVERLEDDAFVLHRADLTDSKTTESIFEAHQPRTVIHLAAQPGIAYSLTNPMAYVQSNIVATTNVLEQCRRHRVSHLVYASSSSVYGANSRLPFSVHEPADHPVSFYAATKRANELMAHSYSHNFGLPTTGLRFFTVYGPWGRPDMAYYSFAVKLLNAEPITIYGDGTQLRDFTYVDDIAEGVVRIAQKPAAPDAGWSPESPDPARSRAPYRLFNIGHGQQVTLNALVELLEQALGRKARRNHEDPRAADMPATHADVADLVRSTGFVPETPVETGIERFAKWFLEYHGG